jgi:hypothetical protein
VRPSFLRFLFLEILKKKEAQQKFLSEIFAELPKLCILHFEF